MSTTQQPEALRDARWYMIDKDGMATLCADREDAEKEAKNANMAWPHTAPHRAVQLVEVADVEALRTGYAAARLEIESLQARIKTMAEERADELTVAHLDGRMRGRSTEPAGEYPALPEPDATTVGLGHVWNRHSMRAYVDADRAMRAAQPAGAQQPAQSAAAAVNPDPHAELRKTWQPGQRWQARSFRNGQWGPWTDAVASEPFWFPHQDYRRHPDDLAPQPSPTPQADSQPAPVVDHKTAEHAMLWRQHCDKLNALVMYCPTCCQGFIAQKEMTRDQIIYECGKTAGRATRTPADNNERAAFEQTLKDWAAKDGDPVDARNLARDTSGAYENDMAEIAWTFWKARADLPAAPRQEAQEPVMIYHGDCTIDCGEHGHHHVELLRMIPAGSKLYTAPQPLPASQGDALDAARYRWLRQHSLAAGQGSITVELDDRANGHFSRSIFLAELDAAIDAARAAQEGKSHDN